MPITSTYQVKCDVCFGAMDGEYDTREDAEAARQEFGWEDDNNRTACPDHNTRHLAARQVQEMDEELQEQIRQQCRTHYDEAGNALA